MEKLQLLSRRLIATVYDAFLLAALCMITTAMALALNDGLAFQPGTLSYQLLLLLTAGGFYTLFWHLGGQTAGMLAWRIQVASPEKGPGLSWRRAWVRYLFLCFSLLTFGLPLLWALVDKQGRCLHDMVANTHVRRVNKEKKTG